MNPGVAAGSALGAAALFATATAVQARALRDADGELASGAAGQLRTLIGAFRSRMWLVGTGIAALAFGLHALALHEGNLSFVQPLLVTMVVFALPAGRALGASRLTRSELAWAVVLVLGLAAFFVAADPIQRHGSGVDVGPAGIASGLAALTVGGCVALARRRDASQRAALLGGAAGIAFAAVAALLKTATDTLAQGFGAFVGAWQLYAMVCVGAAGIVLSQLAYKTGPLSASLPALNSVNPLASVIIGVAVFDEHFRTGAVPSTVEAVGLVVVTLAVVILSRLSAPRPLPLPPSSRPGYGREVRDEG